MTNAAPHSLPTPSVPQALCVAELNLRGIEINDCLVVLADGELPVARLELSLADANVHTLIARVELPERSEYTLKSRLYVLSVERVGKRGRALKRKLSARMRQGVIAWCESDRVARIEIENAWDLAERWDAEAKHSYQAAE